MAKQILNTGVANNDKSGDTLRAGGLKIKANFEEIYTALAQDGSNISGGNILKTGSYADLRNKPEFADIALTGSFDDLLDKPNIASIVGAPTELIGSTGDSIGNIAFDGNNLYVATSNYSNGQANIWKYIPWGGGGTSQGYNYIHNQDPTSTGGFSLDNEDPSLATVAYIATSDVNGNDIHPFYQYIFNNNLNANLEVISATNPQNRALFKVTGITEMVANDVEYYELNLVYIMHSDSMTIDTGIWDLHFDFTGPTSETISTLHDNIIAQQGYITLAGSEADFDMGKYLQIRPGENDSHIHFDTGDNSAYDVIVGDDFRYISIDHLGFIRVNDGGNEWQFKNGRLKFPSQPPTSSIGQINDEQGMIAVDNSYLYYCTADYTNQTYSVQFGTEGFGPLTEWVWPSLFTQDVTGWTITGPDVPAGVTVISQSVIGSQTTITLSQAVLYHNAEYTFTPPTALNIWKRVAWSNDTW